jgi:hypothetical protein
LIYRDGRLFANDYFNLMASPYDLFGSTGIVLAGFGFLTIVLMASSSGVAVVIFGTIGLVVMGLLTLLGGSNPFTLGGGMIWLVVAGGVLLWKIGQRRAR